MVLVPQEMIEKMATKNENTSQKTGIKQQTEEFRDELNRLLKQDSITPEEAYNSYMQLFSKYLNLEKESNAPISVVFKPEMSSVNIKNDAMLEQNSANDQWLNEKLLLNVPKNKKATVRAMVEFIKENKVIETNKKGEIVVDRKPIRNSHILDLIHYLSRDKTKNIPPVGLSQFARALKMSNIPSEYIGNNSRRKLVFNSEEDNKEKSLDTSSVDDFASAQEVDSDDTLQFEDIKRRKELRKQESSRSRTKKRKQETSVKHKFDSKPKTSPLKYSIYDG